MSLPNPDRAIVDIEKLRGYCLSADHPRGKHKARVLLSALGLAADDSDELPGLLLNAARTLKAEAVSKDRFGARYVIDFAVVRAGRSAIVRSAWIVRTGEEFARFTSCYVK